MNKEEIRLIKGYFNDGYCCDLDELKDIANKMIKENQQLQKQKDDVVEAIKGILEINNNYSVEKLAPFYSRKWLEDTQSDLLRMLGEINEIRFNNK